MARDNQDAQRRLRAALDDQQRKRGDEAAWRAAHKNVEAARKSVDWAQWRRDHGAR